jgi:hypothetical protein
VLWTVVCVVIGAIIAFTVAAFLILRNQGSAQGSNTLTIISIVVGVVIGLIGLMISFLQWHHPKHSTVSDPLIAPHSLSQLTPSMEPTTESSAFFQQSSPSPQTASSTSNSRSSPDTIISPPGGQVNKDADVIVGISTE